MNRSTASVCLFLVLLCMAMSSYAQSDSPCNQGRAIAPAVDPRNIDAICFPEIGRTQGKINDCVSTFGAETYGRCIWPVGDVSNDGLGDWIIAHQRCDTAIGVGSSGRFPIELLLYKGVRGQLPNVESAERIGPSEIGSITDFLAAGDWDNDGYKDIAVRVQVYNDTNAGNAGGYDIASLIVFWGDSSGHYTLADTTRLSSGAQAWLGIYQSVSADVNSDGVEDLIIRNSNGLSFGQIYQIPYLQIYQGHYHRRWGKDGVGENSDWSYWNRPYFRRNFENMVVMDHDGDGAVDVVFHENTRAGISSMGVLYGRQGRWPDTTEFQRVSFDSANGQYSLLSDVTGDGIPELLLYAGTQDKVKIYIGLKGQRLLEQYGTGNQPPQPDNVQWWGHPWAEIWLPRKVNPNWFGDYPELYDLGDGNGDGVNDIWCFSWPYLLCYSGGEYLDSLVDGLVRVPLGGVIIAARLGDIDGSGQTAMAVSYDGAHSAQHAFPGGIIYITSSRDVSSAGTLRRLPEGTGKTSTVMEELSVSRGMLHLTATPNPSNGDVQLRWDILAKLAKARITVSDARGGQVAQIIPKASDGVAVWSTAGIAPGSYFVTLYIDGDVATTTVVVH